MPASCPERVAAGARRRARRRAAGRPAPPRPALLLGGAGASTAKARRLRALDRRRHPRRCPRDPGSWVRDPGTGRSPARRPPPSGDAPSRSTAASSAATTRTSRSWASWSRGAGALARGGFAVHAANGAAFGLAYRAVQERTGRSRARSRSASRSRSTSDSGRCPGSSIASTPPAARRGSRPHREPARVRAGDGEARPVRRRPGPPRRTLNRGHGRAHHRISRTADRRRARWRTHSYLPRTSRMPTARTSTSSSSTRWRRPRRDETAENRRRVVRRQDGNASVVGPLLRRR